MKGQSISDSSVDMMKLMRTTPLTRAFAVTKEWGGQA